MPKVGPKVESLEDVTKRVREEFRVFEKVGESLKRHAEFIWGGVNTPELVQLFERQHALENDIVDKASGLIHKISEEKSGEFPLSLLNFYYAPFSARLNELVLGVLHKVAPIDEIHSGFSYGIKEYECLLRKLDILDKDYTDTREELNEVDKKFKKIYNGSYAAGIVKQNGSRQDRERQRLREKQQKRQMQELGISFEYGQEILDDIRDIEKERGGLVGKIQARKDLSRNDIVIYGQNLDYACRLISKIEETYNSYDKKQKKHGKVIEFFEALYLPLTGAIRVLQSREAKKYINEVLGFALDFEAPPSQLKEFSHLVMDEMERSKDADMDYMLRSATLRFCERYKSKLLKLKKGVEDCPATTISGAPGVCQTTSTQYCFAEPNHAERGASQ